MSHSFIWITNAVNAAGDALNAYNATRDAAKSHKRLRKHLGPVLAAKGLNTLVESLNDDQTCRLGKAFERVFVALAAADHAAPDDAWLEATIAVLAMAAADTHKLLPVPDFLSRGASCTAPPPHPPLATCVEQRTLCVS